MCVDVLCQFESLEQLTVGGGLSHGRVRETLRTGLLALLSPSAPLGPAGGA